MKFVDKLLAATRQNNSLLCVGLDPEPDRLPLSLRQEPVEHAVVRFCRAIIEATEPYVCAFKPNIAFFEALGPEGLRALQEIVKAIPAYIPIIVDAKRGDIGNTACNYATALFGVYGFDAATVNPYMGRDSVEPFLAYQDKGVFLLCRTSNPGAGDFQDLPVQEENEPVRPLYEVVARRVQSWNTASNCGLVVGATYPGELRTLREICPTMPILIPGVGAQGGNLREAVVAGMDARRERAIISVSRSLLYTRSDEQYAIAAAYEANLLRDRINEARYGK